MEQLQTGTMRDTPPGFELPLAKAGQTHTVACFPLGTEKLKPKPQHALMKNAGISAWRTGE